MVLPSRTHTFKPSCNAFCVASPGAFRRRAVGGVLVPHGCVESGRDIQLAPEKKSRALSGRIRFS